MRRERYFKRYTTVVSVSAGSGVGSPYISQRITISNWWMKVVEESHVASIAAVYMRRVDNFYACFAADFQSLDKLGYDLASRRRLQRRTGSDKVILHIDDNQGSLLWIDYVNLHGFLQIPWSVWVPILGIVVSESPVGFEAVGSPGRGYFVGPVRITPNFSRKGFIRAYSAAMSTVGRSVDDVIGIATAKKYIS
jgi:hypothetical protein